MKNIFKQYWMDNLWFKVFSIISVGLLIASFVVPPTGIIDPSVLAGVGELFAFSALASVNKAIDKGVDASITHRDTTLQFSNDEKENDDRDEKINHKGLRHQ